MTINTTALVAASVSAALVLVLARLLPWVLRAPPRLRTRMGTQRVGLSWMTTGPARRGWVGRRLTNRMLPGPLALLGQMLVLDAQGPGAQALRWRLIRAGEGHRSITWVRGRQVALAGLLSIVVVLAVTSGTVPAASSVPLLVGAWGTGLLLPLADLAYRARQRRDRLRHELVDVLYSLATLVGSGLTLEAALHEVSSGDGELMAELRAALGLKGAGVGLDDTLILLAERCDTVEITAALRRMVVARGSASHVAPALREMASATRLRLREAQRVQKAQTLLATTALLALLGLPPLLVAVLYPVAVQALQGGGL